MTLAQLYVSEPGWLMATVFIFSLLIGSFLNVVIHRLPIMMEREWHSQAETILSTTPQQDSSRTYNLITPRSACPHCHAQLSALQNIPVLSWLALKARCAHCKHPISPRYPLVEMLTALLSAVVAGHFGFNWHMAAALVLTWTLIALSAIDLDHQLLPDSLTLPLLWLGLACSLVPNQLSTVTTQDALVGAMVGYLSLWLVYHLFKLVTGKEGMGYGDFKLLAALGAWLGWQMLPLIILLSACIGATVGIGLMIFRRRDHSIPIPFGPYLAAAGWIALLWGQQIISTYLGFIQG